MDRIRTGRDPFARQTIRKRKVLAPRATCGWCGGVNQDRKGNAYLWQYHTDADTPRASGEIRGLFCGVDCLNDYHR